MDAVQPLSPTQLRAHVYEVLDAVLATGRPCRVKRGDRELLIIPAEPQRRRLDDLPQRQAFVGSVDELVEASPWQWTPDDAA